jgi:precorrin-4/cobalt-precorrin-4 C11-methyltransferase
MATDPSHGDDDVPLPLKADEAPQSEPETGPTSAPPSRRPKVWFVGAGPGDPDLLTVKGRRLLETADTVFYSGSLTADGWLSLAKPGSDWRSTARLSLRQFMPEMVEAARAGRQVVRLASGDPALFGALGALTEWLGRERIEYEVVPGVSSFLAAAAALGGELTIPEVAQSVIITRTAGRAPMPEGEQLADLARHGTRGLFELARNPRAH